MNACYAQAKRLLQQTTIKAEEAATLPSRGRDRINAPIAREEV